MEYEIKIKPLVLFDLEDKIMAKEQQSAGSGAQFYNYFLFHLSSLQKNILDAIPVYQAVNEYVAADASCRLFYTVSDATIYIMGLR